METKYGKFINESNINMSELRNKIHGLKTWLVYQKGLGMMTVIDNVLLKYKNPLNSKEIQTFNTGLNFLKETNYPEREILNKLNYKLKGGISNASNVKVNGEWSYVNKLNTNYSDISDLLTFIIERMLSDKTLLIKKLGTDVYDTIMGGDVEGGLMKLNTGDIKIENIINYYIKNLSGFMEFTGNIKENSDKGEIAENKISNLLIKKGFEIKYQGGNGDFIDMIFGCDLIVYREDIGYKTVQVKSYFPKKDNIKYYKDVDWLAIPSTNGNGTIIKEINKLIN